MKLYVKSNVIKAAYGERITREEIFVLAETGMVGMVSAFRGYLSDAENNKRTEELRTLIGTCGYDVAEIKGKYQEEGSGEISEERTLIVISDKKPDTNNINEFRTDMLGFGAKFQQDSIFIIYGKSDKKDTHPNTTYLDEYGTSGNTKNYRYSTTDNQEDVDYSHWLYKTKMLAKDKKESKTINNSYSCIGELWERESKFEWGSEESITEVVKRGEYTLMKRFTHIAPERAFAAYSETLDGGAYSIFANTVCSNYCQNILRMQSKMFSGSSSRAKIIESKRKLYNSTM